MWELFEDIDNKWVYKDSFDLSSDCFGDEIYDLMEENDF